MHHPSLGFFSDHGLFGAVVGVLERCARTHLKSLADPFAYALACHPNRFGDLRDALAGMVTQNDSRPLCLPPRRGPRFAQALEAFDFLVTQLQLRSFRPASHTISVASNIL